MAAFGYNLTWSRLYLDMGGAYDAFVCFVNDNQYKVVLIGEGRMKYLVDMISSKKI